MSNTVIAVFTIGDDLHALAIQKALENYADVSYHIVETNRMCASSALSWSGGDYSDAGARVANRQGEPLDISQVDLIWWRRVNGPQTMPPTITNPIHVDVINNDCRAALLGIALTSFSGCWINDPTATNLSENKLIQLRAAERVGFRVPRTLVSQDPTMIKQFCATLNNEVVVKAVRGTNKFHLFSRMLSEEHLASEDSLRLCPAIYQEYIPGNQHIRALCFGSTVHAILIESEGMDWRENLDVPFSVVDLPESVRKRLRNALDFLGLRMGVIDLKLTGDGEVVWLEVNPQGQFLFAEALSGFDLTTPFAEFLYRESMQARPRLQSR
jgi:hypothetical protein